MQKPELKTPKQYMKATDVQNISIEWTNKNNQKSKTSKENKYMCIYKENA